MPDQPSPATLITGVTALPSLDHYTLHTPAPAGFAWVWCRFDQHGEAILDIFNDAIAHSTALYEYEPRTRTVMQQWFHHKANSGYPVFGLVDAAGRLAGFASYGPFRPFPAFQYTVEHSLYLHADFRGRGLGASLLHALIECATAQQRHVLVGGIDSANAASIALHQKLGFTCAGVITQAGHKFGRWLDLAFYQRVLVNH